MKKQTIPLDQILFAIPAALFILSPILDLLIYYFATITHWQSWESYAFVPYFPTIIAGVFAVALIVRLVAFKDRNLFKKALQRTQTFRTELILFAAYLILMFVSVAVNGFSGYALHGHDYTKMSVWLYMANVLVYFFASSLIYDERVKEYLVKGCCIVATFYAVYGITQLLFKPYNGGLRGTFHHNNHYGYYLAVSISLTAATIVEKLGAKKPAGEGGSAPKKVPELIAWFGMMFVQCVALGYCDTLGAWIAVLFSHIFLFVAYWIKDGRCNFRVLVLPAIFLGISVLGAFFVTNLFTSITTTYTDIINIIRGAVEANWAGSGRWLIWKLTLKHIFDKPLFGNGIEGLLGVIMKEGAISGSPHNEYLEYMAFFGIPAGVAYFAACLSVFIHGLRHKKELSPMTLACLTGGFGYLVSAFFGVCFFYTVAYPFIFLGLSLNFTEKDRPAAIEAGPKR